ncbi:MAG TPA: TlpA disulfide reductase family protein [Gammaproteobacteria bacterium]|nr:TlpA disulfide reductase family protein [Gammaproteobacteria bacterium]
MSHHILKHTLILALVCGAFVLPAAYALDVGDTLPTLRVTTLSGKPLDLKTLHGNVVVLNLWATWCAPCREEMPVLDAFYRQYKSRGVVVFGLSEDDSGDLDSVRQAMKMFSYPAALAADAQQDDMRAPRILPVTYVMDRKGVIRAKLWGGGTPVSAASLAAAVDPLLQHMQPQ